MKKSLSIIISLMIFSSLFLSACKYQADKHVELVLENDTADSIDTILVSIPLNQVRQIFENGHFKVMDGKKELAYQFSKDYLSGDSVIILPHAFKPHEAVTLTMVSGQPILADTMAYGHIHKERDDDFAWENNRNGYRVFGPALEAKGEISSGIDFFTKRTNKIVLDEWFAAEIAKPHSYHIDRGEGMDYYMVGRSLGLGSSAPFFNGKLYYSNNYSKVEILEQGPLRFVFRLHYSPYMLGNTELRETRTVVCDAYSSLNHFYVQYDSPLDSLSIGMGCVTRDEANPLYVADPHGMLSYTEPAVKDKGITYVGIVSPKAFERSGIIDHHVLGIRSIAKGEILEYYSGGSWNKGYYPTSDKWNEYLCHQLLLTHKPIKVQFK